jgi:hypothetical protein
MPKLDASRDLLWKLAIARARAGEAGEYLVKDFPSTPEGREQAYHLAVELAGPLRDNQATDLMSILVQRREELRYRIGVWIVLGGGLSGCPCN